MPIFDELDGAQHFETVHSEIDRERDSYMNSFGIPGFEERLK